MSRWHRSDTIEWLVLLESIPNVLLRRRANGLGVGGFQSCDRRVLGVSVARKRSSVVWTFVVVGATTNSRIKTIDDIGSLHGALLEVMRLVGFP